MTTKEDRLYRASRFLGICFAILGGFAVPMAGIQGGFPLMALVFLIVVLGIVRHGVHNAWIIESLRVMRDEMPKVGP